VQFADDQAASNLELDDGTIITKCEQCRGAYRERKPPQKPPCNKCRVDLMEENIEIEKIYLLTRNQVITGMNGQILDIDIKAIKVAMDIYEIKNQPDCLDRVRRLFFHFMKKGS